MRQGLPAAMVAVLVVALLGVSCGSSAVGNDPQETLPVTPVASDSLATAPEPTPSGTDGSLATPAVDSAPATGQPQASVAVALADLVERPLSELSPEVAEYMATRSGPIGVAVVVPGRGAIFTSNGDQVFHMASVAKVAIMATVMDRAVQGERELTERELNLFEPMITVSDNASATTLWHEVGGAEGVETYLQSIGLNAIEPNTLNCWGASYAPADEVALLLAELAWGEILDAPSRDLALSLLSRVDPAQSWGVTAGVPDERPEGTLIGIKDGWYPADCGWWVNSAGVILPGNDEPAYTIAVMTAEQSTLGYGIETIEGIAALVHSELHG